MHMLVRLIGEFIYHRFSIFSSNTPKLDFSQLNFKLQEHLMKLYNILEIETRLNEFCQTYSFLVLYCIILLVTLLLVAQYAKKMKKKIVRSFSVFYEEPRIVA